MHGSLSPSNYGVSGRWLDFGSISTVSDYHKFIIPRGGPNFLEEEIPVRRMISDLYFYLGKFRPDLKITDEGALKSKFDACLRASLEREFIWLCGLPEARSTSAYACAKELYTEIEQLIGADFQSPTLLLKTESELAPTMPERMQDPFLPDVITAISKFDNVLEADNGLSHILKVNRCRQRFVAAYFAYKKAAGCGGYDAASIASSTTSLVMRRNAANPILYRTNLHASLSRVSADSDEVNEIISRTVDAGTAGMTHDFQSIRTRDQKTYNMKWHWRLQDNIR